MNEVTVLVVDDEPTMRTMMRMMLPKECRTIFAADGDEALQTFNAHTVDLVFLDVMMPKRDGFSVCEELRQHSDVPVIICSSLSRQEDIVRATSVGANAYITKPFSSQNLRQCLDSFIPN